VSLNSTAVNKSVIDFTSGEYRYLASAPPQQNIDILLQFRSITYSNFIMVSPFNSPIPIIINKKLKLKSNKRSLSLISNKEQSREQENPKKKSKN